MPDETTPKAPSAGRSVRRTGIACAALVAAMIGLAYASVPLYDLFCKTTGYDGTPLVGKSNASKIVEDTITIHFDTNVSTGLPWTFQPETPQIEARLGETKTVFFRVKNTGATPSAGIAAFNVQPPLMGGFFVKIACFCFNEQTLKPGETMDFPVVFYVEPSLRDDSNTRDFSEMTLSYTYFPSKNGQPTATVATTGAGSGKSNF